MAWSSGFKLLMHYARSTRKAGNRGTTAEKDEAMPDFQTPPHVNASFAREELPLRVRDAAVYLGVSPQTVYLWVERKQIPHFRVMGRNIRFLKSDLQPFRAQFKQEVENWQDQ
jgi:excisionase family DNA binding protein